MRRERARRIGDSVLTTSLAITLFGVLFPEVLPWHYPIMALNVIVATVAMFVSFRGRCDPRKPWYQPWPPGQPPGHWRTRFGSVVLGVGWGGTLPGILFDYSPGGSPLFHLMFAIAGWLLFLSGPQTLYSHSQGPPEVRRTTA